MMRPRPTFARSFDLRRLAVLGTLLAVLTGAAHGARAQDSASVAAGAAQGRASHTHAAIVPIDVVRNYSTSVRLYHVTFQLSPELALQDGVNSITPGEWLGSGGDTTNLWVLDNGGGSYTVDAAILGLPCADTLFAGTLFRLAVTSVADTGTGSVTITDVVLRDCDNGDLAVSAGAAGSVRIDNNPPTVTVTSPNGGETWVAGTSQAITWTATDDDSVATIDLALSTDGGASFPTTLASALPNTGTWNWTVPASLGTQVRVRATAHDVSDNAAADSSDADFTIGQWILTPSAGAHGSVSPAAPVGVNDGGSQAFTFTADPGWHVGDVLVDAVSVGPVHSYTFVDVHGPHTIAVSFDANPAVTPLSGLVAARLSSGNDADGTEKITLSWPARGAGDTVKVYRAAYGNYPHYDDPPTPGSTPVLPTYPPPTPWQLTAVSAPEGTDEVATRDDWYFVAFVVDSFGTFSPVSNMTGGTLNYALGDVTNGITNGVGDNLVNIADLTLLGAHYGLSGAPVSAYAYLDVGPTTDHTVNGRPMTDNILNFEDLVLFAIDFNTVSPPQSGNRPAIAAAATDELRLDVPAPGDDGAIEAHLRFAGTGAVQALSAHLAWNAAAVEPQSFAPGELLDAQDAIALSPTPGAVDVARLGTAAGGLTGEGELALVRFRRIGPGDPGITLASVDARDRSNVAFSLATRTLSPKPLPAVTAFGRIAPNPVRESANIGFALARGGNVSLAIYGVDGRRVRTLLEGVRDAGEYQLAWDGRDDGGSPVAAGVYFARLATPEGVFTRTFARLR